MNPKTTKDATGNFFQAIHAQPYAPAIDAAGQRRLPDRSDGLPHRPVARQRAAAAAGRYPPASEKNFDPDSPTYLTDGFYQNQAGGSHVVVAPNTPGDAGSTYTGVPNLRSVP